MPVPSGAITTEVKDGWSFAGVDELDVKSLGGREEELESLSSEYAHLGQQRQEMRLEGSRRGRRTQCPGINWSIFCTDQWLRKRLGDVGARACGGEGGLETSKGWREAYHLLYVDEDRYLCIVSASLALSMRIRSSSPLGPAITIGVANATTSRDLTRCMIATIDTMDW